MAHTTLALAAAALLAQVQPSPSAREIRVSGEGRAAAAPDVARVTLGVVAVDKSLARAQADATARMRRVLASLEKAGVAAKDLRTAAYDVAVERSFKKAEVGEITGYRVASDVAVTVRDIARVGSVLDDAVAAGANSVGGLALEKEDVSAERARALEAALADARARASVLARAAGGSLGEVLRVDEGAPSPPIPYARAMAAEAKMGGVPISTGQIEVTAQVQVTFALK